MFNFNFMQKNYQLLLIIIINYNYRNSQKNRIAMQTIYINFLRMLIT